MRSVWRGAVRTGCAGLLVLLLTPIISPDPTFGQTGDPSRGRLSVGEPRVQVSLNPSAAAEGELRFTYDGSVPTSGKVAVLEYHIGPEGPQTGPATERGAFSSARWITVNPPTLALPSATPEVVRYRVQVPPETAPGDYSALVLVETDPPGPRAGVRLTVNVPGLARIEPALLTFAVRRDPASGGLQAPGGLPLFDGGPLQILTRIENRGNVQLTSGGKVEVADLFGNPVASLDLPTDQIFPADTATFISPWAAPPAVGLFTARLRADATGAPLNAERRLLVLPWQQVLAALLFALALRLLLGGRFSLPLRRRPVPAPLATPVQPAEAAEVRPEPRPAAPPAMTDPARAAVGGVPSQPRASFNGSAGGRREPDVAEMVGWGQQAARAGDRLVAYRLFVQAVELDPSNEEAWLWRAGTADDPPEAIRCLNRVLEINPENIRARRGLEEVQRRFAKT